MSGGGFRTLDLGGITVPCPEGWEQVPGPDGMLALAHPPVPEGQFRPNIVLRRGRNAGASVTRHATAALAGTLQQFADAHIISNDLWPVAGTDGQLPGRLQRFVHSAGPHSVCVDRWLWVGEEWAVEATASYSVDQLAGMKLLFEHMVHRIRIGAELTGLDRQAGDAGSWVQRVAPAEPRQDEHASRLAGVALEDLSALAASRPYREQGTMLPIPALELLDTLHGRHRLGAFQRRNPAAEALRSAGLLAADGTCTPAGRALLAPAPEETTASLILEARNASGASVIQAWIGGGVAKLAAGPSLFAAVPPAGPGQGPNDLAVQVVPANAVPKILAEWVGIAPAWSVPHDPVHLALEDIEARLQDPLAPPPSGLDPAAQRMWNEAWTEWTIRDVHTGGWFRWINAGRAGQYRIPPDVGDRAVLEPVSPAIAWDTLVRFLGACVEGVPLHLPELYGDRTLHWVPA